jgi:hypothetical protein
VRQLKYSTEKLDYDFGNSTTTQKIPSEQQFK